MFYVSSFRRYGQYYYKTSTKSAGTNIYFEVIDKCDLQLSLQYLISGFIFYNK